MTLAGTRIQSAAGPQGTPILTPETVPDPSARLAVVAGHHPRWLAHRGGEQGVTGRHAVQHRLLQVAVTPTDDGQHAEGQRGQGGHRSGPPADLGQRRGHGHHAELVPAEKGRQRERQQPRPAEFLPQRGVIGPRLSGRLGMVEHLGGDAGDRLLGLTEGEVHPDRHRSS
jgi:hypothetical protein